jgi:hypothetical protein
MTFPTDTIFQPIFSADVLEDAVVATLRLWMPTYLREIEYQRNLPLGRIEAPKVYTNRNEFTGFPQERMPLCVVVSPGIASPPRAEGDGNYTGWWALGVGIVARASTDEDTNKVVKIYGAALRAIMLQKPMFDNSWEFAGVEWVDETFIDIPTPERELSMRSVQVIFRVWVDDLVNRLAGPAYPTQPDPVNQPGSVWPEVETADVTVEMKED